jgi:hypothetical protein
LHNCSGYAQNYVPKTENSVFDPDPRIGSGFNQVVDPDPESGSTSGSRRAKRTQKNRKNSSFEGLDVLFLKLKAGRPLWRPRDKLLAIFIRNINFFYSFTFF